MNILITGARGFIGKNLVAELENIISGKDRSFPDAPRDMTLLPFDLGDSPETLSDYAARADFVVHLAGVNRPKDPDAFMRGNGDFTQELLALLRQNGGRADVLVSSSAQAAQDNPYGLSKRAAEDAAFCYARDTGARAYVYRLPNVFGKWCRPNYNSAVATFCHNIARDLPITVNDPAVRLTLAYIDDVVAEFIACLCGHPTRADDFCRVPVTHEALLGDIADALRFFRAARDLSAPGRLQTPDVGDAFTRKLYATYLSYLPENDFAYDLRMNSDARGSFTEMLRTPDRGQVSVNISRPGIAKGNHWHHTKNEKFLVAAGEGVIRLRRVGLDENGARYPVYAYPVSGERLRVVDIPTGYTHNIENTGKSDMITVMWASEPFDPDKPDTFFEEV